ncbi:MAG: hypothetical protein EU532_07390 [Promethearchaeota archaeon]|nr:MAG: hypothetical protein EU532_07390 [Candidatus Lokiarchaeota archaeon]
MSNIERDFIVIHIIFAIICAILLSPIITFLIGIKLFILVIIYNVIVPFAGILRKNTEWVNLWLFSLILSVFQIWPDWFLSAQLEILVFPEDGLFKIGTVSGYMLFLWAIPFFVILFTGKSLNMRYSQKIVYLMVALLSLLIFGISEMTIWMIGSWYAQNVTMIGHMAIYIIIPEILLGISIYYSYNQIKEKNQLLKVPAAFIVMILYLGNAVFFYFLFERVLFIP